MLLVALTLTACSKGDSKEFTTWSGRCGVIIPYSEEEDNQFRVELMGLQEKGAYPTVVSRIRDYKTTRDTIRDCLEVNVPTPTSKPTSLIPSNWLERGHTYSPQS